MVHRAFATRSMIVGVLTAHLAASPPPPEPEPPSGNAPTGDPVVAERFPEFALPAPGALVEVSRCTRAAWTEAERAVVAECAPRATDEDVALWRLPKDGWVVVAAADDRLCVCAPHADGLALVAAHRIDFGGGSVDGVAGPSIEVGDVDQSGTLDLILHWGSGGCGLAANIGHDTIALLEPARPGAAAAVRFLPLGVNYGMRALDIDANGRLEFLVTQFAACERCTDGKPHNFWVWELVGIQGGRLVDLNATVPDFPRFEWLSFDPKDRWRALLTPELKRRLRGEGLGLEAYRRGGAGSRP